MVSFLYRRADQFIAVTDDIKNTLVDAHGVDPDKINVVRAGVDPESLKSPLNKEAAKQNSGFRDSSSPPIWAPSDTPTVSTQ